MSKFNRILCPIDLSENSSGAIELATMLAKQNNAQVTFCYVAADWKPSLSSGLQEYAKQVIEENKTLLFGTRPSDDSVGFDHQFIRGNAGPEIVRASKNADVVVLSTHGRTGIARLIMGSVAKYVLRYAKCPVYLVKGVEIQEEDPTNDKESSKSNIFVTEVMHHVPPVHAFETMESVLKSLNKARETAAPVIDGSGNCIGILTKTDIERFHRLQRRYEDKDETVINEMFEVDKYGQRRCGNYNFDQVERHMTKEVISVQDTDSVEDADRLFEANPTIHHLVVLDEEKHAVGIVDGTNNTDINYVDSGEVVL